MPVAKIQTKNKSHVGTSDKARSWPLTARKIVNKAPTPPMTKNDNRANVAANLGSMTATAIKVNWATIQTPIIIRTMPCQRPKRRNVEKKITKLDAMAASPAAR